MKGLTVFNSYIVREPSKTRRKRKKISRKPTIYKWLRDRVSWVDYGIKTKKGKPVHCNPNEEVLAAFAAGDWLPKMNNADFDDHFAGRQTNYFTGNGSLRAEELLAMIDIDCHERGTLAEAVRFALYLKEYHFPNLYFETSTNGNGVHGYIVVQKYDAGAPFVNQVLKRLDYHLKKILRSGDWDVETVEIKGMCPEFTWNGDGRLTNYKSGLLAKLPRDRHRFAELMDTTRVDCFELAKLPLPPKKQKERSAGRTVRNSAASVPRSVAGSVTGKVIGDEELEKVQGHYLKVARTLMENHVLRTSGRSVVTAEDVAIFLMLLRFFTMNMNEDGTLPQVRFKRMWQCLYECGDVDRPFDDKRFATIRNYLSSLDLLDWENEKYQIGWMDENGRYHKGRAACWKAGEVLMEMLDSLDVVVEEREKRETSFTGTKVLEIILSLTAKSPEETIRPVPISETDDWRLNPDEIAPYIPSFEDLLELAA